MNKIRAGVKMAKNSAVYINPWDTFFWWWGERGGPGDRETLGVAGMQYDLLLNKSDDELEELYAKWLIEKGD